VLGPLGGGAQVVPDDIFRDADVGGIDLLGEDDDVGVVRGTERRYLPIPLLYKDFRLHWRDLEANVYSIAPFDTGPATAAATVVARTEDNLIFNGDDRLGYQGLLNVAGRGVLTMGDWNGLGNAFRDVVTATQYLTDAGFYGPYAVVVSPRLYAAMNRVYENTGVLEIEQVQKLASAGVYRSAAIPDGRAVVLAVGASNMDLVVGQDLVTAYVASENLNHHFRVVESLILRIKRPDAHRPFRCPAVYLVAPLGIVVNLIMMLFLPAETWLRLVIWMAVGLVIYFGYGRQHSLLRRAAA
jgi:uncharacterized linocin/CFP29 family protein